LGKTYGIKARCYWEHIGNLGNIFENLKGKCWEQKENEKKSSPHPIPRPNLKGKNSRCLECMLSTYPLAACIFGSQNYWSSFLAYCYNHRNTT